MASEHRKPIEDYDAEEYELDEDKDDDLGSRKKRRQAVDDGELSGEEEGFLEGAESAYNDD